MTFRICFQELLKYRQNYPGIAQKLLLTSSRTVCRPYFLNPLGGLVALNAEISG
jgi:hypothetical protein